jgi:hypothetical protein
MHPYQIRETHKSQTNLYSSYNIVELISIHKRFEDRTIIQEIAIRESNLHILFQPVCTHRLSFVLLRGASLLALTYVCLVGDSVG